MVISPTQRQISEKTLELNVCAEILGIIRRNPSYRKVVWQGMTQQQERTNGLDEALRGLGTGWYLMLQFKSPWPTSLVDLQYKFSINSEQHATLVSGLARQFPDSVFYVLPLFATWNKVDVYSPNLVNDTWLIRASEISLAQLGLQDRHRIDILKNDGELSAIINSPRLDAKILNASEAFSSPDSIVPKSGWLPSAVVQDWASHVQVNFAPRRMRSLQALFLPA